MMCLHLVILPLLSKYTFIQKCCLPAVLLCSWYSIPLQTEQQLFKFNLFLQHRVERCSHKIKADISSVTLTSEKEAGNVSSSNMDSETNKPQSISYSIITQLFSLEIKLSDLILTNLQQSVNISILRDEGDNIMYFVCDLIHRNGGYLHKRCLNPDGSISLWCFMF